MSINGVNILSVHPNYNHCIDVTYKRNGYMLNTKTSMLYSKRFNKRTGSYMKKVTNEKLIKLIIEAVNSRSQ